MYEAIKTGLAGIGVFVVLFLTAHTVLSLEVPKQAPAAVKPAVTPPSPLAGKHPRRGRGVNCECQWDQRK